MLLGEGDTFGEEAFIHSGVGSTRTVTAVVERFISSGAGLLYLTQDAYDQVTRRQGSAIIWAPSDPRRGVPSDPLFGFHKM